MGDIGNPWLFCPLFIELPVEAEDKGVRTLWKSLIFSFSNSSLGDSESS